MIAFVYFGSVPFPCSEVSHCSEKQKDGSRGDAEKEQELVHKL